MAIAEWVLKWRHVARKKTFETRLDIDKEAEIYQKQVINSWVKVFGIIPEFRILRLTFHKKSAPKC